MRQAALGPASSLTPAQEMAYFTGKTCYDMGKRSVGYRGLDREYCHEEPGPAQC
jgi:hypothetical protein